MDNGNSACFCNATDKDNAGNREARGGENYPQHVTQTLQGTQADELELARGVGVAVVTRPPLTLKQ